MRLEHFPMDEQTLYMQLEAEVEKYFLINSHDHGVR